MSNGTLFTEETADVYPFFPPGSTARYTNIPIFIMEDYLCSFRDQNAVARSWTHIALIDTGYVIKDAYAGTTNVWLLGNSDTLIIPSGGDTQYVVVRRGIISNGAGGTVLRVYLDRQAMGTTSVIP